jgi:ABC-type glycerol-3-phosphate transport system substrate-binding protein
MNNFQTILVGIFLAFFVFAVLIFSGLLKIGGKASTSTAPVGKVVIWGTFSNTDIYKVLEDLNGANKDLTVTYVKKDQATYQQSLIESFAAGNGPDLFIITPDMIIKDDPYIYKIPYTSYAAKTFSDAFINGADIYLGPSGVIGFPIAVDPIVMYYNKDILSNEGLALPPTYWDELSDLNGKLTKKYDDGTILESMIALGQYDNVTNAKDILATLLLQNNNSIIQRTSTGYGAVLNENKSSMDISPVESVLSFYTKFSNPSDALYSWNRALPSSLDMFAQGKLAFYIGRASELFKIESINPNLSFNVAQVMQTRAMNNKRTYASVYALSVSKKSANLTAAFGVAGLLTNGDPAKNFAAAVSLPPASRALLAVKPADQYLFTFFNSAIISRPWLDPDSEKTDSIFKQLVENILSNKLRVGDAAAKAQNQLQVITNN